MNFKKFFLTLLIFSLIFGFVNAISVSVNPSDNNEKSFTATITFGLGDGNTYCYSVQSGNSALIVLIIQTQLMAQVPQFR